MNALTAALCKKQAIGFAMYLASMCAHNQALTANNEIDLSNNGTVLTQKIYAPMDECYHLSVVFRFDTLADMKTEGSLAGVSYDQHPACKDRSQYIALTEAERAKLGAEIKLKVEAKASKGNHNAKMEFISWCPNGGGDKAIWRANQGKEGLCLKKGHYILTITNLQPFLVPKSNNIFLYLTGNGSQWTSSK